MRWISAWRRRRRTSTVQEQSTDRWDADRRDDADLDAVELYLPVASQVVFRGLDQRVVLTRALGWLRRYADDVRIVGMTWWAEDARDPRAGRKGDFLARHTLAVHVTMGSPSEDLDWGRDQ